MKRSGSVSHLQQLDMSKLFCIVCQEEKEDSAWRHKEWNGVQGWGCSKHFNHYGSVKEWIPQSMKDQRKEYKKQLTQPYLPDGSFNGAFKEHYPEISKEMVKEGAITKTQFEKAKVYKE